MEVTLKAGDGVVTDRDGLAMRGDANFRARAVPGAECADFVARLRARHARAEPPAGAAAIGGAATPREVTDDDVRTSWVDYDEVGQRFKAFKKAAQDRRR